MIPSERGRPATLWLLSQARLRGVFGPSCQVWSGLLLVRAGVPRSFHTELLSTGDTALSKTHLIPALKGPRSFLGADAE